MLSEPIHSALRACSSVSPPAQGEGWRQARPREKALSLLLVLLKAAQPVRELQSSLLTNLTFVNCFTCKNVLVSIKSILVPLSRHVQTCVVQREI